MKIRKPQNWCPNVQHASSQRDPQDLQAINQATIIKLIVLVKNGNEET